MCGENSEVWSGDQLCTFLSLLFVPGVCSPVAERMAVLVGRGGHRCGAAESRFTASDSESRLGSGRSTTLMRFDLEWLGEVDEDVADVETA